MRSVGSLGPHSPPTEVGVGPGGPTVRSEYFVSVFSVEGESGCPPGGGWVVSGSVVRGRNLCRPGSYNPEGVTGWVLRHRGIPRRVEVDVPPGRRR